MVSFPLSFFGCLVVLMLVAFGFLLFSFVVGRPVVGPVGPSERGELQLSGDNGRWTDRRRWDRRTQRFFDLGSWILLGVILGFWDLSDFGNQNTKTSKTEKTKKEERKGEQSA